MRRRAILWIAILAGAALMPSAQADHPGGQTGDLDERDHVCDVHFTSHAVCTLTSDTGATSVAMANRVPMIPTPEGWHAEWEFEIVDNDSGMVLMRKEGNKTIPYTQSIDVPFCCVSGGFSNGVGPVHSATCRGTVNGGAHMNCSF